MLTQYHDHLGHPPRQNLSCVC
uniref:Uncharacterized protein n=1 Tax=Arundo donax TaxID=35708 RepID=A0A0A9FP68_ARUDO